LAPTRGAYHDRHDTWGAGCDGRFGVRHVFFVPDETPRRTAKSCGPGAAMLALSSREASFSGMTVTTSPLHRGERDISRKAIAQGMSECFRCPVCSCAPNVQFLAHETAGAARTRHSLRPRFSREAPLMHNSGEIAPREGGPMRWIRRVGKATTSAVAQRAKAEACPPPQRWSERSLRSFR